MASPRLRHEVRHHEFRGFEIALVIAILSSGCTEHYDGTVAEFEPHPDLPVILSAKEYGDCFREDRDARWCIRSGDPNTLFGSRTATVTGRSGIWWRATRPAPC